MAIDNRMRRGTGNAILYLGHRAHNPFMSILGERYLIERAIVRNDVDYSFAEPEFLKQLTGLILVGDQEQVFDGDESLYYALLDAANMHKIPIIGVLSKRDRLPHKNKGVDHIISLHNPRKHPLSNLAKKIKRKISPSKVISFSPKKSTFILR